ncbi:MAG: choice-of-anchor Q domain-containing protein [Dysgonomonas sp.]
MRKVLYLILAVLSFACFSCSNDDDFSSSPNLMLDFSSDVVSFDTVFTTIGSATKHIKIYNKNSRSLVIQSIELMNPEKTGFRMNIDGEKGIKLTNVEILKKDSLFGLIEVTVDPLDINSAVLIRDSIKFTTNGNVQYLYLEAIGQDVHIWKKQIVTKDSVLTAEKPFLIYGSLTINRDASLNIAEGAKFYMKKNAFIQIYGNVKAKGSIEKPIIFRGDRFDKIEGDIPYDNVPGQWDGIYFYPESYGNDLANVYIKNAIRGMTFYASDVQYKKAILNNVIVHNSSEYGVMAVNADIEGYNCLFSNSRIATLILQGGKYSFLHCTLVNYFSWSARRTEALVLSNAPVVEKDSPLLKCDFTNTIIYGSLSKELLLDNVSPAVFNYQFTNCLIKADEVSDSHFINTIWNKSPLFKFLNDDYTYTYNFELKEGSPARGEADAAYSLSLPFDLKGKSRLNDPNPDIGCYEWTE